MVGSNIIKEALFQALVENTSDGLAILNREGKFQYANPTTLQILGLTAAELPNLRFMELIYPKKNTSALSAFTQVIENPGKKLPFLFPIRAQDTLWRWIEGTATNLLEQPPVNGVVINFRDVTRRIKAEEELRFRVDFERMIITISNQLINVRTSKLSLALESALEQIGLSLAIDRCQIFQFSADQAKMNCIAAWNLPGTAPLYPDSLQPFSTSASPLWLSAMMNHAPFKVSALREIPPEENNLREIAQRMGMKSWMDVPIHKSEQLVGFLRLTATRAERQWSADEVTMQKLLAEIIANALQRRDTEARINRQLENLAALHTIDKTITSKTELGPVLKVLLEQVTLQMHIDAVDILLYETQPGKIRFGDGRGFRSSEATRWQEHLLNPYIERIVQDRKMQSVTVPRDWYWMAQEEGFVVYYGVPLIARGEVIGILGLYHRGPLDVTDEWLHFLMMLAEQAAIAIDSVTMFQNLQRSNEELSQAYDTTLEGWARALELRDQETEGHSRRVPWLALRLAREIGISTEEMVHMRRGALLHDIGKMAIPDSILQKPGPLSAEEWEIMRQHPGLAYGLLSSIPFLRPALDIPYCHHEHWDGSGYPRGLKGKEIPIAARIFTIVDVWDALRTKRRYREAWDDMRVRNYLKEQAGKQFDPEVVEAFLALLEQGTRTFA